MAAAGSSGNGSGSGGSSNRPGNGAAAINAAATVVGSADARFHSQPPQQHSRSRWIGCFSGLSCFGSQKGGKRIVPAARIPDGNASTSRGNALQSGGSSNQNVALNLSLLAPPSSPASFSNSALPSTAQSPNCFLSISANSPGGPTSNMFATGPYAHEPQLVSPPVFSTYTTEPSTAPLTPPPELAHATTPSSPDVPYARFLSSSAHLKTGKEHNMPFLSTTYSGGSGLQASYLLYPESPSSSLISPASATPRTGLSSPIPEHDVPTAQWKTSRSAHDSPYSRTSPSNIFGLDSVAPRNHMLDSSFFHPAAPAHFCLDQAQQTFPYNGGRLSVSRESDVYNGGGNRHNACKQDTEETEAYRASFGFSADEIITTQSYVETPEAADESFSISPFGNGNLCMEECPFSNDLPNESQKMEKPLFNVKDTANPKKVADQLASGSPNKVLHCNILTGPKLSHLSEDAGVATDGHPFRKARDEISLKPIDVRKKVPPGQSCSDAEIEYRRARSLREANGISAWRSTLP